MTRMQQTSGFFRISSNNTKAKGSCSGGHAEGRLQPTLYCNLRLILNNKTF
jgi:hypothetical protein